MSVQIQVELMIEKINKGVTSLNYDFKIDDVIKFNKDDLYMLPNAFFEKKRKKIAKLRIELLDRLQSINKNGHAFNNLSNLYNSLCSFWATLESIGDGILSCENLCEIKCRNQISRFYFKCIEIYNKQLNNECIKVIENSYEILNKHWTLE